MAEINSSLPSTHSLVADRLKELAADDALRMDLSKRSTSSTKKSSVALDNLSKVINDAQNDNKKGVSAQALKGLVEVDNELNQIEDEINYVKSQTEGEEEIPEEIKKKLMDILFKLDERLASLQKKLEKIGDLIKKDDKASKKQEELMVCSGVLRKQAEEQREALQVTAV